MKRLPLIFTISIIGLILSSTVIQPRKFKGELYFKLINIGSYYNADSSNIIKFERTLDSLMKVDPQQLSKDNLAFVNIYGGLKKHNLIYKPSFDLKVDSAIYIVYVDSTEFNKVKHFDRNQLISENKKVELELVGEIINLGALNVISCSTIEKVEKVDGKTYWRK